MQSDHSTNRDSQLLKNIPLFAELDDDDLQRIADLMVTKRYKKNNLIIFEDDLGSNLFFIKSGRVKISGISHEGGEAIFSILGGGDFFGELSLLDGLPRSATVTSIEDVSLWVLHRGDFLDMIQRYPQISIYLLKELAKRIRRSDMQIKSLSLKDARGRVAGTLIRLAEDIGVVRGGRVVITELPLQRDLANIAGTSRETISRVIKKFEEDGQISKEENILIFSDFNAFKKMFA
ncbi:MAG: Crp/Fnr family transcriptional regulator [Candidatus Electryonea clarkiae]|nr:Crp/Fnr family transcriptional regulator [Candidatus Electryonea clarkiae]MDP8286985.1 Crp/Fnr family transcriptional regulator [Candidatus Electryonea clarkiae]